MGFDTVRRAISDIAAGKMVIVVDDEDRENEGDLVMAAEKATPEAVNFMVKYARGLVCLPLTDDQLARLGIPMMVDNNTSPLETAFTVSIEAREGVTTGISAADRATTILAAVNPKATANDVVMPGHIFPLRAREGGVLVRTGHTEAAVDLSRLAGLLPAGIICEIMNDDGSMARMPDLKVFAKEHDLCIVSIADLIEYRVAHETLVKCLATKKVSHPVWGDVILHAFGTSLDHRQHLVVTKGEILTGQPPLVRVHSGYPLSDVFGDLLSDDRDLLNAALSRLGSEEKGVLLCLDQGHAPVPLAERLNSVGEPQKANQAPKPQREIGVGAQILRELGLHEIRILTNNPRRLKGLSGFGLKVVGVEPLVLTDTSRLQVVGESNP